MDLTAPIFRPRRGSSLWIRAFLFLMIFRHWDNIQANILPLAMRREKNHSFPRFDGIQHVRPNERNLFALR